jgi:hypothetical protein
MKWRLTEENGGRKNAVPTPSELGKGHEEKEARFYSMPTLVFLYSYANHQLTINNEAL